MARTILQRLFKFLARVALARHQHVRIIGVTGTVGKTTTKEAIAKVLAAKYAVRTSEKNFNNEWGVPFTILGVSAKGYSPLVWLAALAKAAWRAFFARDIYDVLVLEYGVDKPGDMRYLADITKLDIAVITALGETPVHVANFPSREALWKEKMSIANALKPGGTLLYNMDDAELARRAGATSAHQAIAYGIAKDSKVRAEGVLVRRDVEMLPRGIVGTIMYGSHEIAVDAASLAGMHNISTLLAAAAVGWVCNVPDAAIKNALNALTMPAGRLKFLKGKEGIAILDDTYNASPTSIKAALALLRECTPRRRVAALGDMLELGDASEAAHREIGKLAAVTSDIFVAVGNRMRAAADAAVNNGMDRSSVYVAETSAEAVKMLSSVVKTGDVVLSKGSQGMRMEKIVEAFMAEPERAGDLLVRQDREWKKK